MTTTATDVDVLVVGAGPVGLFVANECARRGLRFRIVEANPTQSEHSKALAIFPRTLEIFDMAGVAGPFLEAANHVTKVVIETHNRRLAQLHFAPDETPYSFVAMVPQDVTEKLLVQELQRKGGTVEYETSFISAVQDADHVTAKLDHKGEPLELTARFVVGCDGAHSAVRHLLNLPFDGAVYDASFMLADVETNDALPADEMQLCPSEFGPLAIFPMTAIRRRIVATVAEMNDDEVKDDAPSLDLVKSLVAQRGPEKMEVRALRWSSYFRIHHRQVGNLRVGRMFIAGDAAHIHSPFGGQGMNTGLQDVWNLVWKLDLVLHGHGGEQLLDSYTAERRPVIKSVIEMTHFMTQALATPNKLAQAVRDTVIPMVSRLAPFQHTFVQRLSQLGIAYGGSPIVEGAGKRYFDDSIRGGKGIGSRFLLLVGDDADSSTKDAAKQLCDSFSGVIELRIMDLRVTQNNETQQHKGITLVRPDGYIAYETPHSNEASAMAHLRSLLEHQTA